MFIAPFKVVLDACVLFPGVLRDTLLRTAEAGAYQVYWSERILEELRRNLVKDLEMTDDRAASLIQAIQAAFPEALISRFEPLEAGLGNHPGDRHVVATALQAHAQVIVTNNLKHFPAAALPRGIEAQSPDEFLINLFDLAPPAMLAVLREQAAALRKPPMTWDELLTRLEKLVPEFVQLVRLATGKRLVHSTGR